MANDMTIRTNNVPRYLIDAWELTPKEREEFDYLNWDAIEKGEDSATFFRYRGQLYDFSEFSRIIPQGSKSCHPMECDNPAFAGWDGYISDSFFSGLLVKYAREDGRIDEERIIVGMYCC